MEENNNNIENQPQTQQAEPSIEGAPKTAMPATEQVSAPNPVDEVLAESGPVLGSEPQMQTQTNIAGDGLRVSVAPVPPFVARPAETPVMQTSHGEMNYQTVNDGMRKLKKIKRPVRRIPQGNPLPPSSQQMINLSEDLDELLDNQLNLPVLNAARQKAMPQQENVQMSGMRTGVPEKNRNAQVRFISENDLAQPPRFIDQLMVDHLFTYKGMAIIAGVIFILALFIGKMIFGSETVVKDGLQGVVVNAEVPRGRARCGVAERTQGCVLYIMNPQRQDLQGRDFYDLASQLTGRQRFVVETGNMRYSNVKVRAGEIAQINIPPLQ